MGVVTLPKKPDVAADKSGQEDDYDIKMVVESILPKYSGKGKGLKVIFGASDVLKLESLQDWFGSEFGINQIIIFATKLINKRNTDWKKFVIDDHCGEEILVKPTSESLECILKFGQDNAASILTRFGLTYLSKTISENLLNE